MSQGAASFHHSLPPEERGKSRSMSQQLEDVLEELAISQYLDAFIDQGFDTWETILDITESDLYAACLRVTPTFCMLHVV